MTTGAVVTMVLTMGLVTVFTIYFFLRVLKAPGANEKELNS